jgi:glycosyltransferase involved in cell wall biosynthesis
MRILQWDFPHLPPLGGREIFVERLSMSLTQENHEVLIVAGAILNEDPLHVVTRSEMGIPLQRVNLGAFGSSKAIGEASPVRKLLKKIIDEFAPDVIHLHHFLSPASIFLDAYLRSARRNIPVVYTVHDIQSLVRIPNPLGRVIVGGMTDVIVCPSEYMYRRLRAQEKGLPERLVLIENGVPKSSGPQFCNGDSKSKKMQVLSAANFESHKGIIVLLNAWAKVSVNFPETRLVVAGDGRMKKSFVEYSRALGLEKSVHFPGWLTEDQLALEFGPDTVVVVPSLIAEAFGLLAAEAQMAGSAVVASNLGGLAEIVVNGETGFLVEPGRTSALAEAIGKLLTDHKMRRNFGANGQDRTRRNFDLKLCSSKYIQLYQLLNYEYC